MDNRQRIETVLGYTAKGYALMVEYAGYSWLDRYFATDPELKQMFVRTETFWEWWVNEWNIRDAEFLKETSLRFIDELLTGDELQISLGFFIDKHNVKALDITPNKWVIAEVNKLIKSEKHKIKLFTENN